VIWFVIDATNNIT